MYLKIQHIFEMRMRLIVLLKERGVIPPSHLFRISRNQVEPARMEEFSNSRLIREGFQFNQKFLQVC